MNVQKTQGQATAPLLDNAPSDKTKAKAKLGSKPLGGDEAQLPLANVRPQDGFNVQLSPEARELNEARERAYDIAMSAPAIREDRVKALKEQIKNGSYKPDAGKIADGMLREAVRDQLAGGE